MSHTEKTQRASVPVGKVELLTGKETTDTLALERYGVAVIQVS